MGSHLVSGEDHPHLQAMKFGHLEGVPQPQLGDLLTMVINHLLTGMILQALKWKAPLLMLQTSG